MSATAPRRNKTSYIISVAVPLASAVMVLTACSALIIICKKRIHFKNRRLDPPCKELTKISYSDIADATNEFSSDNLVGSGQFGTVYKATFKFEAHPDPVAVKVFKLDQLGAPKTFFAECEALRNTRHRNLIRVISLCSSLDQMGNEFKALILEYMGNGTLESWLHSSKVDTQENKRTGRMLNLGSRILVAVDIVAALDYLHNWCRPPLVHCDLKPSNVLLDDDMVAHVSDFGLAKFLHGCDSSVRVMSSANIAGPRGSIGYIAPGENLFMHTPSVSNCRLF
jgi:serine/threonine protein kinase